MSVSRFKLIERLFAERSGALQEFFRRRLRRPWDAPDFTQEVYTRMLRLGEHQPIDNPEAYLFTVASNLLREKAIIERREAARTGLSDPLAMLALTLEPDHAGELDREVRLRVLHETVRQLPARQQAVVIWTFEEGLTQEALGERLGVSRRMARKLLAAALEHCRRVMMQKEAE